MKHSLSDPDTGWIMTWETPDIPALAGSYPGDLIAYKLTDPVTGLWWIKVLGPEAPVPDIPRWMRHIPLDDDPAKDFDLKLTRFLHKTYPELAAGEEFPHGPLGRIKLNFADHLGFWGIALPEDDVVQRRRGKICQEGWAVWYLFGRDPDGEFLDYYSAHRMTNDSHVRLHEDGRVEGLPSINEFCRTSEDPEENARFKAEFREENRKVVELLEAKGFGMAGDEPGGVQIIRYQIMDEPEGEG